MLHTHLSGLCHIMSPSCWRLLPVLSCTQTQKKLPDLCFINISVLQVNFFVQRCTCFFSGQQNDVMFSSSLLRFTLKLCLITVFFLKISNWTYPVFWLHEKLFARKTLRTKCYVLSGITWNIWIFSKEKLHKYFFLEANVCPWLWWRFF